MATKTKIETSPFPADFLAKIKVLLEAEQIKLSKETKNLAKTGNDKSSETSSVFPNYGDSEDDSVLEVAEYEANLSLQNDFEKALRDLQSALLRLKNGGYGICKYCHRPIEKQRLLARPTSSACVECKKAIVQEI